MSIAVMRACRGDGVRELEKEKKDEREEKPWHHCPQVFVVVVVFIFSQRLTFLNQSRIVAC